LIEIDQVVDVLKNGEWHTLEEVINRSKLTESMVERIVKFLVEYDFINLNQNYQKVKVTPSLLMFFKQTQNTAES
jgi:DNA-binding IclR family transcriptional regulator